MSLEPEQLDAKASDNTALEQPTAKKKRKRPDGIDADRYKGHEKWSYRCWAWQFLRRNPAFQAACESLGSEGTDEEKAKVAAEFGLKKYKSFKEGYVGASGRPIFATGAITSWSHLDATENVTKKVELRLDAGQVLIRFDLASALADVHVLEKQLRLAERRLRKRLDSYAKGLEIKTQVKRHKVGTFIDYLRLLDGCASGHTQIDIGLIVSPDKALHLDHKCHTRTREDLASAFSKKIAKAAEYSFELYRYLAVLKGRPKFKEEKPSSS